MPVHPHYSAACVGQFLQLLHAPLPSACVPWQVRVVNNLDWFGPMSLLTFLRDIGKFARVGNMMAKDSVRTRMESESGISYTEFTYQLLQVRSQGLRACSSGAWALGRSRYHGQLLQARRTGTTSRSLHDVTS